MKTAALATVPSTSTVPAFLERKQPQATFSISDNAHLTITVGDTSVTITPEDIRRLDRFMGAFGGAE